jgi:PAS domain S-box-containing protein
MKHVFTKHGGIRKRIIIAVTLLLTVSFALLGTILSVLIYQHQKGEAVALEHEIVGFAANEMHWDLHELEALLDLAEENYAWQRRNGISQADFISQILMAEHVKHNNIVEELSFIDETGRERERVSRTAVFSAADLRDLAKSDEFVVPKKSGEVYYGPVTFERGTFAPYMTMSVPIKDARRNAVEAVLMAKIRLNKIWQNAVERTVGKTGIVFITDSSGKVLAHPDPSVVYRNTYYTPLSPEGIQKGLNGADAMLVSRRVETGNRTFIVYASEPVKEVLALSRDTLVAVAFFSLGFLIFSILLSLAGVNRVIRPVEALADNARRITAGELTATVRFESNDEIGDLSGALSLMTSRLMETIHSLEQRNEFVNNVLNSLTHPFYVINASNYMIELANPAARFGTQVGKMTCYALTHNSGEPCSENEHPCVIKEIGRTGDAVTVEHVHHGPAGERRVYEVHGYPIRDREGNIVQVIEYNVDITERKRAEEGLQLSEQKNRAITSAAKDAIIMADDSGRVLFWNPAAEKIFGYTADEMIGRELHRILSPESYREGYTKGMETFLATGRGGVVGQTIEITAIRKDGTEFPVALSLSSFEMNGKWHAVGIARDITQRKLAEDRILASLEEKKLLLQEIHHRVKNNLQIISSLLDLQREYVAGREPQEVFNEIKNRVKSMAIVHEKLYLSKDLSKVDFHDYLTTLIDNLYRSYSVSLAKITLKLEVENVSLGIDTAIPCGLIVNELITNALKYAFPGERTGEVEVVLRRMGGAVGGEGEYELMVKDNGVGIPQELDLEKAKTLGLHLVSTLVEHQLRGSIDLNREGGTQFFIRFNEVRYKKRI